MPRVLAGTSLYSSNGHAVVLTEAVLAAAVEGIDVDDELGMEPRRTVRFAHVGFVYEAAAFGAQRLVRTRYTDGTLDWWRITRRAMALSNGQPAAVQMVPLWSDLAGAPWRPASLLPEEAVVTLLDRSPAAALAAVLDPSAGCPSYVVAGTVASALQGGTVSIDGFVGSVLDALRLVASAAQAEVAFRWVADPEDPMGGAYAVDLVERIGRPLSGDSAVISHRNALDLARDDDGTNYASRVMPVGEGDGVRFTMAEAVFYAENRGEVVDGHSALHFRGLPITKRVTWAGCTLVCQTPGYRGTSFPVVGAVAPDTLLYEAFREPPPLRGVYKILRDDQPVLVVADAVSAETGGDATAIIELSGSAYPNLLRTVATDSMDEFEDGAPYGWTVIGAPTIAQGSAGQYGEGQAVVTAGSGEGLEVFVPVTGAGSFQDYVSAHLHLTVQSGSVDVVFDSNDEVLQTTLTPASDAVGFGLSGLPFPPPRDLGETTVTLTLLATEASTFTLDAATVTPSSASVEWAPVMGPASLAQPAADALAEGGGLGVVSAFNVTAYDLAALGVTGANELEVGDDVVVRAEGLGEEGALTGEVVYRVQSVSYRMQRGAPAVEKRLRLGKSLPRLSTGGASGPRASGTGSSGRVNTGAPPEFLDLPEFRLERYGAVIDAPESESAAAAAANHAAFAALVADVQAAGRGRIVLPTGLLWVGTQTMGGGGQFAKDDEVLTLEDVPGPVVIECGGSTWRLRPGLYYGSFNPDGTPYVNPGPGPNFDASTAAGIHLGMIRLRRCGVVVVNDADLDGNMDGIVLGGTYDIDRQLPASGIWSQAVRRLYLVRCRAYGHALDGVYFSSSAIYGAGTEGDPRDYVCYQTDCEFDRNGRQGFSYTGGVVKAFRTHYTRTGRGPIASAPKSGVDIEAEGGGVTRDGEFLDCVIDDCAGAGFLIDVGDNANHTWKGGRISATDSYAAWLRLPGGVITDALIEGVVTNVHSSFRIRRTRITNRRRDGLPATFAQSTYLLQPNYPGLTLDDVEIEAYNAGSFYVVEGMDLRRVRVTHDGPNGFSQLAYVRGASHFDDVRWELGPEYVAGKILDVEPGFGASNVGLGGVYVNPAAPNYHGGSGYLMAGGFTPPPNSTPPRAGRIFHAAVPAGTSVVFALPSFIPFRGWAFAFSVEVRNADTALSRYLHVVNEATTTDGAYYRIVNYHAANLDCEVSWIALPSEGVTDGATGSPAQFPVPIAPGGPAEVVASLEAESAQANTVLGPVFQTIPMALLSQEGGVWDPPTSAWVLTHAGLYEIEATVRLSDEPAQGGRQFGIGVYADSADYNGFKWATRGSALRHSEQFSARYRFVAGEPLRLFGYSDAGVDIVGARLSIRRVGD